MKKVLLGMSGGVDSSVSAILLKQAGYEVIGCTMRLWESEETESQAIKDARKICQKLGIRHEVIDYQTDFKSKVVCYFVEEYEQAKTPNPCVECNKYIKFGRLYQTAMELGCEYMSTGHYAKTEYSEKYGQYVIRKSDAEKKDQTYFLYTIPKHEIAHLLFPLQSYPDKENTRKIAREHGLEVADKKDSQEICFIPNDDYQKFLENHKTKENKPGDIVLQTGETVGKHKGLTNYTIGQRKGLGISYATPLYVIKLDNRKNEVIVGDEKDLYKTTLQANEINWMVEPEGKKVSCLAKIRYRSKEAKAEVTQNKEGTLTVTFEEPQRAITPGQSVVFYDEEGILLGGGKIIS